MPKIKKIISYTILTIAFITISIAASALIVSSNGQQLGIDFTPFINVGILLIAVIIALILIFVVKLDKRVVGIMLLGLSLLTSIQSFINYQQLTSEYILVNDDHYSPSKGEYAIVYTIIITSFLGGIAWATKRKK